jgi:hypothetical protein
MSSGHLPIGMDLGAVIRQRGVIRPFSFGYDPLIYNNYTRYWLFCKAQGRDKQINA